MKIRVSSKKLKDVWDLQRAKKVLEMCGLSSEGVRGITHEELKTFEEKITLYLWEQIKKQFPKIESFCNGKTGGFNKCEVKNYNTPIICIYGDFYLQLISLNNKNNWCWESVSLEPYRFEFNEDGYFQGLILDAMNKSFMQGYANKDTYSKLLDALREVKTKEKVITIQTQGKDLGKVELHEVETQIN